MTTLTPEQALEDVQYYLNVWRNAATSMKPAPPLRAMEVLLDLARQQTRAGEAGQ